MTHCVCVCVCVPFDKKRRRLFFSASSFFFIRSHSLCAFRSAVSLSPSPFSVFCLFFSIYPPIHPFIWRVCQPSEERGAHLLFRSLFVFLIPFPAPPHKAAAGGHLRSFALLLEFGVQGSHSLTQFLRSSSPTKKEEEKRKEKKESQRQEAGQAKKQKNKNKNKGQVPLPARSAHRARSSRSCRPF